MSETPREYTAQEAEAEAEGVRPYTEQDLNSIRKLVNKLATEDKWFVNKAFQRLIATLDAARAELERKEAEAAVLREAALDVCVSPDFQAELDAVLRLNGVLLDVTAGADLLERVRQLEVIRKRVWGYIALEGHCPVCDAERGDGDLVEHLAMCPYHEHHQGIGAAGEGE